MNACRRIANRESARRVRQKREDQLSDAQKQVCHNPTSWWAADASWGMDTAMGAAVGCCMNVCYVHQVAACQW